MQSRKATNAQILDAVTSQRTKGTTAKEIRKIGKEMGLTSKMRKNLSYESQKNLIKKISKEIEAQGGELKGFGERNKQRAILSKVQQSVKDQRKDSENLKNENEHISLLEKLRQKYNNPLPIGQNSATIANQDQGRITNFGASFDAKPEFAITKKAE